MAEQAWPSKPGRCLRGPQARGLRDWSQVPPSRAPRPPGSMWVTSLLLPRWLVCKELGTGEEKQCALSTGVLGTGTSSSLVQPHVTITAAPWTSVYRRGP